MKIFDDAIVKNPEIFQENRLLAHSDHVCMANWFEGEENSFRMSLDGLWKFAYAKNMDLAIEGFEKESYCCKAWDEVRVPSFIEMEGYDIPPDRNITYPWEMTEHILPGEIPTEFNPVASYVKYFTLPVNMRGERVVISFQGVEGGFAVWLNGQYVGYSEKTFGSAEFELTPYLKDGENKLAVRVWKWTSNSWGEEQKFWDFLGVFRGVYLYMVPRTHLWDVQVLPELSEDFSEGTLTIITTTCGKGEIEVRLLDDTMQEVLAGVMAIEEGEEESDEIQSGIAGMVYAPKLWSAETPNLYMLQLEVRDENGDLTEVTSIPVGFRRFERKDGILTLNGRNVVLKGVNCHEIREAIGHVSNREEVEKDIIMMKQNNINAVYSSHYTNASYLYELCDIYGLYVIVKDKMEPNGMMLDDGNSCYQVAKNHPAFLMEDPAQSVICSNPKSTMQEIKYNYQNVLVEFTETTFTVWNKHLFTNTDVFSAAVILQKDGQDIAKVELPISVEPLEKKTFDIPQQILGIMDNLKIASAVHEGGEPEFAITVSFVLPSDNLWGKRGHEVAFGQYIYKKEFLPYTAKEPIEVMNGQNTIVVKGNHFKAVFSRENASLISYRYGGAEMLKRLPSPNFWRVPERSEDGRHMLQSYAQWKIASMYMTVKCQKECKDIFPAVEELEDNVKLTYTYDMPTVPASSCQVCYHVFGDGTIETTMVYEPVEGLGDMPEFGMMFKMDASYHYLRWYGLGPEDTYVDCLSGAKLGIYENRVEDNMTKYPVSRECGNKCGVRFAEVTDEAGRGMRFFGDELSFCALPYTPHELENAGDIGDLPEVNDTVIRIAQQQISKKKVFTFCFCGV